MHLLALLFWSHIQLNLDVELLNISWSERETGPDWHCNSAHGSRSGSWEHIHEFIFSAGLEFLASLPGNTLITQSLNSVALLQSLMFTNRSAVYVHFLSRLDLQTQSFVL